VIADETPAADLAGQMSEDVAAEMVKVMRDRHPALAGVPAGVLIAALAEVLPVYGAMVELRTFGSDYVRRESDARALTKRAYGAGLLLRIAAEAEAAARAGIEPAANKTIARLLRDRAHAEGSQR
jgi:hypothetical protein